MPAIRICGRRWLAAADDFVYQGVIVSLLMGSFSIAGYVLLANGKLNEEAQSPAHCPGSSNGLSHAVLAQLITNLFAVLSFWVLAVTSMRGRILEPSKRGPVAKLVCLCWVVILGVAVANCVCFHYAYYHGEVHRCPTRIAATLSYDLIGNMVVWLYLVVSFITKFDPSGGKDHGNLRETDADYVTLWKNRCSCATTCCCIFGTGAEKHELLHDVSLTMARLFDAHDIVMSDITAGLILLREHQHRMYENLREETRRTVLPDEHLARNGMSLGSQARVLHPFTGSDRNDLQKLQHFARYYLGAYGYLLFWYQHLFTGLPRLWASDCTMCCRKPPHAAATRTGDCCYCNMAAIKKVAQVEPEDVLMTSFENRVLLPAFYVAVDHSTNSVVVAIRGSMSLPDCITDVVAQPKRMPVNDLDADGANEPSYVHGGMLRCTQNVYDRIQNAGVLAMVVNGAYSAHNVVVVGHSLGAGVATLLTVMLRDKFPEMRPRLQGFAYAPPGGLMTKKLSEYTDGFVTAAFMGKDLVPRLSAHTMNDLRDSLFLSIAATQRSKAQVLGSLCCPRLCGEAELPEKLEASDEELACVIEMLRPSAHVHPAAATAANAPSAHTNTNAPFSSGASGVSMSREMASVSPIRAAPGRSFSNANTSNPASHSTGPTAADPMLAAPADVKLYPPNRLYHFVKAARRPDACGCICGDPGTAGCCKFNEYWPVATCPEELQEVVVSPLMVLDHMPDRFFFVMMHSCAAVDEARLQPLVSNAGKRPGPPGCPENAAAGETLAHTRMLYRPNVDVITHRRNAGGAYGAV